MKLTKNDIELLAARALDILEAQHDTNFKEIRNSKEFKEFEESFNDPTMSMLAVVDLNIQNYRDEIQEINTCIEREKDKILALVVEESLDVSHWKRTSPEDVRAAYIAKKKAERFPGAEFEKTKLLNKLKTDLLVSDAKTAQAALDEIVKING